MFRGYKVEETISEGEVLAGIDAGLKDVVLSQRDAVLSLLCIYDKADRESVSEKEIGNLSKLNGLKSR